MSTDEVNFAVPMPQPCDEWLNLMTAADSAGRWAARQLASQCSAWHLGRGGSVSIHVEPADSPVVAWLYRHGYGSATSAGLLMPVTVTAEALHPAAGAAEKSRSLLVRHAYATAFCTVLAEEAGAAAEIQLMAEHTVGHRTATGGTAARTSAPAGTEPRAGAASESALTVKATCR